MYTFPQQPWYALAPVYAHLTAMMNVATVALIRIDCGPARSKLAYGLLFLAAMFVAFALWSSRQISLRRLLDAAGLTRRLRAPPAACPSLA